MSVGLYSAYKPFGDLRSTIHPADDHRPSRSCAGLFPASHEFLLRSRKKPGFLGLTPTTRSWTDTCTHLLEGELLVVGLDTSDIVRRGGIQGVHEQVKGGAELGRQESVSGYSLIFTFRECIINTTKCPQTGGSSSSYYHFDYYCSSRRIGQNGDPGSESSFDTPALLDDQNQVLPIFWPQGVLRPNGGVTTPYVSNSVLWSKGEERQGVLQETCLEVCYF